MAGKEGGAVTEARLCRKTRLKDDGEKGNREPCEERSRAKVNSTGKRCRKNLKKKKLDAGKGGSESQEEKADKSGGEKKKKAFFKPGRKNAATEQGFREKKGVEECHFTIWNAFIQIGGRSFAAQRMQLYLHCHIPPCLDNGKRHPGKSHCRAWELHKS